MALSELEATSVTQTSSWADLVEKQSTHSGLLPRTESTVGCIKTVTDYYFNENGDKCKVVSKFKVVTKSVPKAVARRKSVSNKLLTFMKRAPGGVGRASRVVVEKLRKFGASLNDGAGPKTGDVFVTDEVRMAFTRNRAGELLMGNMDAAEDSLLKLKEQGGSAVHCRYCKQNDHWSVNCPYKDYYPDANAEGADGGGDPANMSIEARKVEAQDRMAQGKYVAPAARRGGVAGERSTFDMNNRDDNTVRVTNLPEETEETDLRDIFGSVGKVTRTYLARDKVSGASRGFAFVTYEQKDDAEKAIVTINGHRYDHCILKVEWAKPSAT